MRDALEVLVEARGYVGSLGDALLAGAVTADELAALEAPSELEVERARFALFGPPRCEPPSDAAAVSAGRLELCRSVGGRCLYRFVRPSELTIDVPDTPPPKRSRSSGRPSLRS